MCGLFGIFGQKTANADELAALFGVLASLNVSRGADSYGVWNGTRVLARAEGTPTDVFHLAREALREHPALPVLGHTRLATRGRVSAANAHPFTVTAGKRRYVAAHNGGVSPRLGAYGAELAYEEHEVDSEAFFQHVLGDGGQASDWEGYGTFIWTVSTDSTVRVGCAGTMFELACATVDAKGGTCTVWSSEADHLAVALRAVMPAGRVRWHTLDAGYWHVRPSGITRQEDKLDFAGIGPRTRLSLLYSNNVAGYSLASSKLLVSKTPNGQLVLRRRKGEKA